MPSTIPPATLERFTTFGDLLRFLRRRAGITQLEFSIAVGYSDSQISRLEQNMRLPDPPMIEARFVPALYLEDEPMVVARLMELAATVRREDAPALGMCPYKGLDYFDETDAELFVGREVLTDKLARRVLALVSNRNADECRFLAIVGASGSGKSSLVRAGLVPALRWDKTSANWPIHVLTPSAHPLASLATALARAKGSLAAITALMDDLARDPRTLGLLITSELKTTGSRHLLLVIDQFEESFALCRSEDERSAFINNLINAASDAAGEAVVVITLRADFYAHCAKYLSLREALAATQEYIGAMSDEEMRRAVEEPARRGRWEFEPGLVDLILHDVGHEPGALPLLSHALFETWQRRHGRTMTLSGYASAGGVRGAIAETAEAVFTDQFTHEQQAIARRIFLRLTELGDETSTGDTRRRATFAELILKPDESDATQAVLKALADARLITTSEDSVQVAHEALIREWPTLRGWLEDNREGLRLHRQLTESTHEWLLMQHEPDMLFRGARLAQAREWAASHADDMNAMEREFLAASVASSGKEAAEREATRQRELEATRILADTQKQRAEEGLRAAKRLRLRAILASSVGILAVLLAIFALFAWQRSASQADLNRSLSLAGAAQAVNATGSSDLALALALEAVNTEQPAVEALSALRTIAASFGTRAILTGHSQTVKAATISSDGKFAFSGSCAQLNDQGKCLTGELILWDLEQSEPLQRWSAHAGWITAVAISPDGQMLISGGEDGLILLWDSQGVLIRQLAQLQSGITDLELVPSTDHLLTGSADGSLILWDIDSGETLQGLKSNLRPVTSLAIAGNKSTAVSAHEDGSILVWDLNDITSIRRFSNMGNGIRAIAITPDARRIFFTSSIPPDFSLRMIDSESGEKLAEMVFGCAPGDIALSPDASYLLLTCSRVIINVDLQNFNYQVVSTDSLAELTISISQDGRRGLSASMDGNLRVWNLTGEVVHHTTKINADFLLAFDISPDGNYLLVNDASKNGLEEPALLDMDRREVVRTYEGFRGGVSPGAVAISPDRQYIAAAGMVFSTGIPQVMVWELESGELKCVLDVFTENGRALAFSPINSQLLLVGSQELNGKIGQLILFDVQTCDIVRKFNTSEEVSSIDFSSDGSLAITGSSMLGRFVLWDVSTGEEVRRFSYPKSEIALSGVFVPGDTMVLGSGTGGLYLWHVNTSNLLQRFTGIPMVPWCVAVSPDGKYVLSGVMNGDVILWDFATGEEFARLNAGTWITDVQFSSDSKTAYAIAQDGQLIEIPIAKKSLSELKAWIGTNRYVRELTADEKTQYHVEP